MFIISKIICLDIGDVFTGVAHSDANFHMAFPFQTWKTDLILNELEKYQKKYKVDFLIIGMCFNKQGQVSQQGKKIEIIANNIKQKFPLLQIIFIDEFGTSCQAQFYMKQSNVNKKIDKTREHAHAASIILSDYLNNLNK